VIATATEDSIIDTIEKAALPDRIRHCRFGRHGIHDGWLRHEPRGSRYHSAQGSHLDATEAVKAIKLVKSQEKGFSKKDSFAILFTRTSAAIRPRTLQSIETEFSENKIPMFGTQIPRTRAFTAPCSLRGTLTDLDPAQVANPSGQPAKRPAFLQGKLSRR